MSIMLTDEDRDYGSGLRQGFALGTRLRWYAYPGNCPPDIPGQHDNRCLCWIETPDGMAYIGLRIFRGAENDYGWYSGHTRESGNVTHWMPLPEPPWVVGSHVLLRDDLPFMRATPTAPAARETWPLDRDECARLGAPAAPTEYRCSCGATFRTPWARGMHCTDKGHIAAATTDVMKRCEKCGLRYAPLAAHECPTVTVDAAP